jgi:hypothetical protein
MSQYDSSSDKCTCSSGYIFDKNISGNTTCVSENEWCRNRYGLNSKYNTLTDKCECSSGYEFSVNSGDILTCDSCFSKYGLNSSYNYINKKCECDDGYVANGNSCITYTQSCQIKYGPNSFGDKQYCHCNSGYQWNTLKTGCVEIEVIPTSTPVQFKKTLVIPTPTPSHVYIPLNNQSLNLSPTPILITPTFSPSPLLSSTPELSPSPISTPELSSIVTKFFNWIKGIFRK